MGTLGFILLSVVVFTGVILLLVILVSAAESKLVQTGDVTITINDDPEKSVTVPAGQTLLSALSSQSVFLPSACGGGGTCAMCKCKVLAGGGDVLPTETGHLTRAEQKEHWRLGCQVKIKQDLKIRLPEEIFGIQKFDCTVKSNDNVATFIKELVLEIDGGKRIDFQSGGYIQIDIPAYSGLRYRDFQIQEKFHPDWDKFKVWDFTANNEEPCYRAYSMANHPAEGNIVMLNVRIASPPPRTTGIPPGIASSYIFNLKAGDKVVVSGPYGEFFIKETQREMMYIGGGAGMAPLRSHIFHLFHTLKTGRKVSYWYGARSKREIFYEDHFREIEKRFPNFSFHIALSDPLPEDDWKGDVGFIHQVVLDNYLGKHEDPGEIEYYLCGPPMMLSAVQKMLYDMGVEKDMIAFDDFG
ncbi:MAG: NADH:ubiquinone reductase (Na(+)-transporting) subunit F [Elusimicrobia bacterium CG1_02_63_36]|nr:MAG: NADH:ubiquinone reductase (Na(+)-transporting) subunit F [Elusimicrobia bacterium CG1_02_63_36]PIP83254.1 MAG: NADH:ubiquinone reductase (Na(+)-transporting) subunit F [Elusimicrobia bacterium CG22_combo_CG10-13_8_21_14_all_63_91]PJA14910.1 MAG: NADH:ubiquinone reductase (Na(+)-transporting) subunit F [Elusimicrobia bacterium CG_4_10_14_0_2_um_filter_63_34]PJB25992.1 MAG: NADH:ubiquinone reductase (Na(+)-transporting) subunit F [Elusimicrobia bacterium CG_4_9_14_3_um_filter_62_55]